MPGRIILLNGASSSGKSSIARGLQRLLEPPHLFAGIDSFTPMLRPDGHMGMDWRLRTNANAGGPESPMRWAFPEQEGDPVSIEFGDAGHRLIYGMHRALAALAHAANDVIFEHALLYPNWRDDLLAALNGLDVYLVGVRCPIDVIEQRERARGDRVVGQARGHYEAVHAGMSYDIEIDTSTVMAQAAAKAIAGHLSEQPPGAFRALPRHRK